MFHEGRQWRRFAYAVFAVLVTATLLTQMMPSFGVIPYRYLLIPWSMSVALIAYFAGVFLPRCPECGAKTIPARSPKGEELIRNYGRFSIEADGSVKTVSANGVTSHRFEKGLSPDILERRD